MEENGPNLPRPTDFRLSFDNCGNAEISSKFRREHIPYLLKAMGIAGDILSLDEEEEITAALSTRGE